jgi:hypothetical protein
MKPENIGDFVQRIKPEDFDFTIDVDGIKHDVYHFEKEGKVGTIAFALKDDKAIIPMIKVGRMTEEEVEKEIRKAYKDGEWDSMK